MVFQNPFRMVKSTIRKILYLVLSFTTRARSRITTWNTTNMAVGFFYRKKREGRSVNEVEG